MTVNLSALAGAGQQFFTDAGVPLSGGKLYSYTAGTTTPQTTYTSASGSTAHANPIILDSAGRVSAGEIWLTAGSNYKFVLKTSLEVTLATWDNITGINGTGIATNASNVQYDPAGTGAVSTTVQAKLRQTISSKDFGAVGDGTTDDTAALQAALNALPQYGELIINPGTYIISSTLTVGTDNVIIRGQAVIKAKANISFSPLMNAASRTGLIIKDLDLDANQANRISGQAIAYSCMDIGSSTDCLIENVIFRNTRGFGGGSAVSLAASGGGAGVLRLRVTGCKFLDCGVSATANSADGVFMRGRYSKIDNCFAYKVTDTAFVMEGCQYSEISDCVVQDSTAFAGITNDTSTDRFGNMINGLTGTTNYVGSLGGVIAVGCFGAGNLYQTSISNVTIRVETGAGGGGPGVQLRHTSTGRVIGVDMENVNIDTGSTVGVMTQGIFSDDCDNVKINNSSIVMDTNVASLGSSAIYFRTAGVNNSVNDTYVNGSYNGLNVGGTSNVLAQNNTLKNQAAYGLVSSDTATVNSIWNTISGSATSATIRDVGATLYSLNQTLANWTSWTPTLSTDLGNAAFSFASSTITLAKLSRVGNTVSVVLTFTVTLNAITPFQLRATLIPTGYSPANDNMYGYAQITEVTGGGTITNGYPGHCRALSGTDQIVILKTNAAYTASSVLTAALTFTYEAAL